MVNYQPNMFYFTEWWKQLFGESEGKDHKGIYPSGANFTTDLHSLGQFIQDGTRNIFETVISINHSRYELCISTEKQDEDGLNYLAGKRISEVNEKAEQGTLLAHVEGGVPNIRIKVPEINEETLGQLIYFFEFACALSGYTLGVNPFDQPGVEAYKKKMFSLLGKPGDITDLQFSGGTLWEYQFFRSSFETFNREATADDMGVRLTFENGIVSDIFYF